MKEKIRELQLHKRKSFRILMAIELILLLAGIPGLFGKDRVYEYGTRNMQIHFGTWDQETGSCFAADGSGQSGNMVDFSGISLPRGMYRVALRYQTDTAYSNSCTVSRGSAGYKGLLTNGGFCYPESAATDFEMWLLEDADEINIHAYYGGQGNFSVSGLSVSETNALNRIWIFCVLAGGMIVNLCYLYAAYDRQFGISTENKTVHFVLAVLILFSAMPLMVDYIPGGADMTYHLLRVEGIKDSILNGQFPNRIAPKWQQGYGYASAVFYGETALYIMALFRLIGFTILTSYRMFFTLLDVVTVLVSYYCFKGIWKEKYVALLCTAFYSLSIYKNFKTFLTGGFGESIALTFLPVLVYGFYRVFSQDVESREYKRSFIPLTIGFSGLIQTHLLTGELAGLFTVFLCLIQIKKVFRRQTFIVLVKTLVYSCLLSAWFLVPFADYMLTGDFVIHHVSARTIQARGLYPAHLFLAFPIAGGGTIFETTGMYDSQPACLGIGLTVTLMLWVGFRLSGKTKALGKEELGLGRITAWFAAIAMIMSLSVFPWDDIQRINGLTATLVSSLQFPSRMLSIAVIMLTVLVGVTAKCVMGNYGRKGEHIFYAAMAAMLLMSNIWLLTDMAYDMRGYYLYNAEGMGYGYISGAEYLPYGADTSLFIPGAPKPYGGTGLESYEKEGLTIDMKCVAAGDEPGGVDLPLLYYKGYQAWDTETGERFAVRTGENFSVRVELPAGYSGNVRAAFVSPVYWRIAECISMITFCLLIGSGYMQKRHKRKDFLGERKKVLAIFGNM